MSQPKGTREQIHDLVDELDPEILDDMLFWVKAAVKEQKEIEAWRKAWTIEEATTTI